MPRPKYILCAETVVHDKATNLLSFINVIEGYAVTRGPENVPEGHVPVINAPFRFAGIAAWELDQEDNPEEELEYELTLTYPGEGETQVSSGKFRMAKRFHRFTARIETPGVPVAENSSIIFRSKVRRHGDDWSTQEYAIPIVVLFEPAENPEPLARQEG